jgi:hypothetical protein
MWRDNQFVAMLDPVQLSDGVDVADVRATTLRGRVTWVAASSSSQRSTVVAPV